MVLDPGCPVCGGSCTRVHPEVDHYEDYPFLPGGRPRVPGDENYEYVIAPHAISGTGEDAGRKVYGAGDKVPMDDAVKYGIADGPAERPPAAKPRGKRATKPASNRARKPASNR